MRTVPECVSTGGWRVFQVHCHPLKAGLVWSGSHSVSQSPQEGKGQELLSLFVASEHRDRAQLLNSDTSHILQDSFPFIFFALGKK